VHRSKVPLP